MAWTNQAILDTLLGASAMLMILASIGGTPSYNIILPLYLGLGLYTRIPRALLVGLVGLLVSVVADICWLSISGKAVLSSLHSNGPSLYLSTAGFGVVMTILNLLAKVPMAWYTYQCFTELGGLWVTAAGGDAQPATEEYYGMSAADGNATKDGDQYQQGSDHQQDAV
ncbi:unnamed protein product [Symbiodinium sp. KB8]|nr:unnamed protein product [Symbiodinium sp. KB8]